MDLERAVDWTSNSNSETSSSSSTFYLPADRMVRIELEAAEALADLAHLAKRRECSSGGGGGSPSKWGSKGKRAKKRVKSESPPHDSALNPVFDSSSSSFKHPPPQDQPAADFQQKMCESVVINHVKPEQDAHIHSPYARSFPSYGGGRSRQNLTEAEKEARRLRRILANRESARQTIRRRQALCEELTRKAASLALENENLKREKELVLKEQQFLESTNKQLKTQMAHNKALKAEEEEEEAGVELKPSWFHMPFHQPTNCQMIFYNQHPLSQLCWPSIIQSSNAVQSQQEIHENRTTSLCLMSCPWFLPLADSSANGQNAVSVDDQCYGSSSSQPLAVPLKLKPEAGSSPEVRLINDLNEFPMGERGGEYSGKQNEVFLTPASVSCVSTTPSSGVKSEIGLQSCSGAGADAYHQHNKASQPDACGYPEKVCGDPFSFTNKKPVDAAAATMARRRRKELTRLKHLHGARQCRMNC